ncbi:hypothetical protein ACH9EU_05700 [Kocuria sp. M1R5S2]|uniref:hypothetical protein n=1 Tax=Kocuria rhizosphaerae TaxID=3376285 RepID=UPI0037A4B214
MAVSTKRIEAAAEALSLDPKFLQVLTRPSTTRTVPVQLRLLGNETVYVATREQADKLEHSDRAYEAVTAA